MQILRLLAARRAASTIIASPVSERLDDEGDFFELDFSSCSIRASPSSSDSLSISDSDDECTVLDFITSLERSSSASPLFRGGAAAPLNFCASDPPSRAKAGRKGGISALRTLSFRARKAAPMYDGGRHSFARSSSGRRSYARSGRSLPLFMDSPPQAEEDDEHHASEQTCRRARSRDVIRRCLANISRRLRTAKASPRAVEARGVRRLRKCRSASSAAPKPRSATAPRDDSVLEKQDGIAGAIAHCKESLRRASTSECDSPLLRSRSDPGNCEAAITPILNS